jgi:transposase-like protein
MTPNEISDEVVREFPDFRAAIRACLLFSGKQMKGVAFELGIEPSHLSKMVNAGDEPRHFPPEKIPLLMSVCGNEIPLRWLSLSCGYPSPLRVSSLEAELVRLRMENEQLRGESKVLINVFKSVEIGK